MQSYHNDIVCSFSQLNPNIDEPVVKFLEQVCRATGRVENDSEQLMQKPSDAMQLVWRIEDKAEEAKNFFTTEQGKLILFGILCAFIGIVFAVYPVLLFYLILACIVVVGLSICRSIND